MHEIVSNAVWNINFQRKCVSCAIQCSFEKYQVADLCLRSATTTHETLRLLQKFYNRDDEKRSFCDLHSQVWHTLESE